MFETRLVAVTFVLIGRYLEPLSGTVSSNGLTYLVRVPYFLSGGLKTLGAEDRMSETRGRNISDECSLKERSTLPRGPKPQEYLSRPTDAVLMRGLSRRNSSSQAKYGMVD